MNEQSVQKSESNNSLAVATDLKSLQDLVQWGEVIAKSSLTPLKKGEDVAAAVLMGKELGLTPMTAIQHLTPINGKVGMSVALQSGIVAKAGIVIEILEDFVPLYGYKDVNSTTIYTQRQVDDNPTNFVVVTTTKEKEEAIKAGGKTVIVKSLTPNDYRTTIKMSRAYQDIDKTTKSRSVQRSRTLSQYKHLFDKDNWKYYPSDMLMARVQSAVIRVIAPDLFTTAGGGVIYTTDELTEEGVATVLEKPVVPSEAFKTTPVDISGIDKLDAEGQVIDINNVEEATIVNEIVNNDNADFSDVTTK